MSIYAAKIILVVIATMNMHATIKQAVHGWDAEGYARHQIETAQKLLQQMKDARAEGIELKRKLFWFTLAINAFSDVLFLIALFTLWNAL